MTEFAFRPREWWQKLVAPIDPALLAMLALLIGYALLVLTSASPERLGNQAINLAAALVAMRGIAPFGYTGGRSKNSRTAPSMRPSQSPRTESTSVILVAR